MILDEAIKHAEEVAVEQDKLCKRYDDASGYSRSHNEAIRTTDAKRCEECASEHRQLAEWLKDYKRLKEQEPCEDAISRQRMLKYFEGWKNQIKYYHPYAKNFDIPYEEAIQWVKDMPPVNPQKPICPSAGVDCEDCPAYEKKSECEHDHEILKAYSDGASAVLDKIRAEIDAARFIDKDTKLCKNANASGLEVAMDIIDKYIEEGKG